MFDPVDASGIDLQERIDALATRLVLDGADRDFVAALVQLSECAGSSGYRETARVASELAGRMHAGAAEGVDFGDTLSSEISRLQQVLKNEAHRQPRLSHVAGDI